MEELDTFTEGKQPGLRTCINTNTTSSNDTCVNGNDGPMRVLSSPKNVDTSNVENTEYSSIGQNPDICQNDNAVDTDIDESNYASTSVSSRSDSSSVCEQNVQNREKVPVSEVEKAISVAALLQHGSQEQPQGHPDHYSDSNEEGYDSEDEEKEINDSKLLEFMLQNSQSQEDFHHQYDQLATSVQESSVDNVQSEQRLSDLDISNINVSTIIDNVNLSNSISEQSSQSEKQCWVCFASEEDDTSAVWTSPCRCRGTTKWVHQVCIQRWVDEKQKGNNMSPVECPQCQTKYVIHLPGGSYVIMILDKGDLLIQQASPMIVGGVCVGSLYWTCATFGAVTLMQTLGQERCLSLMEGADPITLLIMLPLIPVGLGIGKMIRWEERVLKSLRRYVPQIPFSRYVLPAFNYTPKRQSLQTALPDYADPVSVTRTFCGALFLPTIAVFLGSTLYKEIPSQLKRTLLGGLTFVLVKGVIKIYHKQHNYIRQSKRQILDFKEDL